VKTHPDMIGPRHREVLERLEAAAHHGYRLSEIEQEFLQDMAERLETYGERTLVTAKQLNFLTRIEAKLEGHR
jgi:hypothetical protein